MSLSIRRQFWSAAVADQGLFSSQCQTEPTLVAFRASCAISVVQGKCLAGASFGRGWSLLASLMVWLAPPPSPSATPPRFFFINSTCISHFPPKFSRMGGYAASQKRTVLTLLVTLASGPQGKAEPTPRCLVSLSWTSDATYRGELPLSLPKQETERTLSRTTSLSRFVSLCIIL